MSIALKLKTNIKLFVGGNALCLHLNTIKKSKQIVVIVILFCFIYTC